MRRYFRKCIWINQNICIYRTWHTDMHLLTSLPHTTLKYICYEKTPIVQHNSLVFHWVSPAWFPWTLYHYKTVIQPLTPINNSANVNKHSHPAVFYNIPGFPSSWKYHSHSCGCNKATTFIYLSPVDFSIAIFFSGYLCIKLFLTTHYVKHCHWTALPPRDHISNYQLKHLQNKQLDWDFCAAASVDASPTHNAIYGCGNYLWQMVLSKSICLY